VRTEQVSDIKVELCSLELVVYPFCIPYKTELYNILKTAFSIPYYLDQKY